MGDINQLNFIKANLNQVLGPILEIGSKNYGNTPNYRLLFPFFEFIGTDMEEGNGVDLVLDFTENFENLFENLGRKKFKTVICFSVLEHCKEPFKLCNNISKILDDNGVVFISVPFAWRIHAYPSDYWRFTPDGIKILFPEFDFECYLNAISTNIEGEIKPINNDMFSIQMTINRLKIKPLRKFLKIKFIYLCLKLRIFQSIFKYPLLFPPVLINMIGRKKK